VEGSLTAVTETIVLPNQPASGQVTRVALGGDGLISPMAAYAIKDFALTGDGTGLVTHLVQMDPKFCAIVAYVTYTNLQATAADQDVRMTVGADEQARLLFAQTIQTLDADYKSAGIPTLNATWNPTPLILQGGVGFTNPPFIRMQVESFTGDVVQLSALVYLFDINVRNRTPIELLYRAMGGRGTAQGSGA